MISKQSSSLSALFSQILAGYPVAYRQPLAGHPLARLLRQDLRDVLIRLVADPAYLVKVAAGQGRWPLNPSVSILDPKVTDSPQRGHFVVYSFRGDGSGVYLSLNQESDEAKDRFGRRYLHMLEMSARESVRNLPVELLSGLEVGVLNLPGRQTRLTQGFCSGNIAARFYPAGRIPGDEELATDLRRFLQLFRLMV